MPERMKYIMNDIKICVLGGDRRQLAAAREMCKDGYEVAVYGIEGDSGDAVKSTSVSSAVKSAALCVLPLPFSTDGIRLSCPLSDKDIKLDTLYDIFEKGQIIAGGKISDSAEKKLKEKGCIVYDYCKSERFGILNAVPTSEGALAIAMNGMDKTIFGSRSAVIGFGRIGKVLAEMLKNLKSDVSVFARSDEALSWAEIDGYTALSIKSMEKHIQNFDVIFNTVPFTVLGEDVLRKTKSDVYIVDLASSPGGVDFKSAKELNKKVVWALSLPGKVAPESAGKIISDCILSEVWGDVK